MGNSIPLQKAVAVDLPHFVMRVDREMDIIGCDSVAFERNYHTQAENLEQATIKFNKYLLANFPFENFPDAFFLRLEVMDDFLANEDTDGLDEETKNIYALLDEYSKTNQGLPYEDGNIIYDETTDNTAYAYRPILLSEQTYQETKEFIAYIEI